MRTDLSWWSRCRWICSCSPCAPLWRWQCSRVHNAGWSDRTGSEQRRTRPGGRRNWRLSPCRAGQGRGCGSRSWKPRCRCSSHWLAGSPGRRALGEQRKVGSLSNSASFQIVFVTTCQRALGLQDDNLYNPVYHCLCTIGICSCLFVLF